MERRKIIILFRRKFAHLALLCRYFSSVLLCIYAHSLYFFYTIFYTKINDITKKKKYYVYKLLFCLFGLVYISPPTGCYGVFFFHYKFGDKDFIVYYKITGYIFLRFIEDE